LLFRQLLTLAVALRFQQLAPQTLILVLLGQETIQLLGQILDNLLRVSAYRGKLFRYRLGELQQPGESRRTGPMQGGAEGHLHRFQLQAASLFPFGENAAQQCRYFPRNLRVDCSAESILRRASAADLLC
jgi:hypothetical protein